MGDVRTVLIAGGGTGGHLMPALAVAQGLRSRHPGWRILMVGAVRGVEATLLPARDFPYALLPFEPIYRRQWWRNWKWPWLALTLLRRVGALLGSEKPALVLGTGGYASAPVVWGAARRSIPTAILEQDAFPGLATRRLAPVVRHVYLSVPEARQHLAPGAATQVFVTGSPIPPPTPGRRSAALARFGLDGSRPVILVVGGSQGSVAINELIEGWVGSGRTEKLTLLWSTGRTSVDRFRRYHAPPHVQVFDFLDPIADAYSVTDLAVCRAGMMTIAELCAWGIASILIPLPSAAADHQTRNAEALEMAGAAVHLSQAGLTAAVLAGEVDRLLADRSRLEGLRGKARERGRPDAVEAILDHLESLANSP